MATDRENPDTEPRSDDSTEWLATTRERRKTAGERMTALVEAEADDELALLFAEEEEDEEFAGEGEEEEEVEGATEADDMEMESSSDDEDQGPNAREDDMQEEEELQKREKEERLAKKRKAQKMMEMPALRKRVKIEPTITTPTTPAPRPKKKSERISWLPTPEDGPTRSSSRRQTLQNKELTHARLKDSEEKRIRLIATMEEAAKRKEKMKPKQMTQADRLAEAAKTERLNSKSLNRWEEMERKRSEDQKRRLEALQNRRLEGPVETLWTGVAKWVNGRLVLVGSHEMPPEDEGRRKRNHDAQKRGKDKKLDVPLDARNGYTATNINTATGPKPQAESNSAHKEPEKNKDPPKEEGKQITFTPPQGPGNFLDGIHIYASMKEDRQSNSAPAPPSSSTTKQPEQRAQSVQVVVPIKPSQPPRPSQPPEQSRSEPASQAPLEQPPQAALSDAAPPPQSAQPSTQPSDPAQLAAKEAPPTQQALPQQTMQILTDQPKAPENQQQAPPSEAPQAFPPNLPPPVIEYSTRNLVVLENFETKTTHDYPEFSIFFNSRKPQKLQKTQHELCPITSRQARHRDPRTNLAYANALAYREIRQTLSNRYAWSGLLGCFVGPVGVGARGVPERFLAPNAPPPQFISNAIGESAAGTGTGAGGGGETPSVVGSVAEKGAGATAP
ncbi:hypothetical protein AJ80_01419 [Polytolypa hystricis UAMH7299]|uniref:Vps72/YL1 C-terminal domain-containing protein n=1 Tax=Polytolypa hystricis (strain UAMH7299) TaxID=1447883 RepID=A0A2B7Z0S6_POLH7|nr:hypothetical protein AJ80_01419 [Polytolypa hystricis UAMH7299]